MTSTDNTVIAILDKYTVRLESAVNEIKTDQALIKKEVSDMHQEIRVLQDDVKILKSDTAHIQTSIYWGFALMTISLTVIGFFITLAPSFLEFLKSKIQAQPVYTTREQVQEMIDTAMSKAH